MLPTSPLSLLVLALLQGSPGVVRPHAAATCQDVQRIELSREPGTREICVSPGLLTGFIFDTPVQVELQDEVRFAEVTRGRSRTSIGIMPAEDMVPGERLRLTARYDEGVSVSFVLVLHSGQATHQVEVYRDKRTRESLLHEVEQEHAKNQQLQGELEQLRYQFEQFRAGCGDPAGLRRLIASGTMSRNGIRIEHFRSELVGYTEGSLSVARGTSYRSDERVAVEVWLRNSDTEPWTATGATLVDTRGKRPRGMRLWQASAIPPKQSVMVVVEVEAGQDEPLGDVTLVLSEDGPRSITLTGVAVPP
ncbi:DUF2381 family protein [Archangium sp.]|uniref:DUF2381 family protein n=1 Tax=Archangium sp. TaxID=1872627 RepID=UPI00389A4C16